MLDLARLRRAAHLALFVLLAACARPGPEPPPHRDWYRGGPWNSGSESYSAWFGDSDGRVLYFGLSPFWSQWWANDGDPRVDLAEPGDQLIGRFDLAERRFLEPLRVCPSPGACRGSVWDVLVHSNGRLYYTTFFEEAGSVARDGSDLRHFAGLGPGLNELAEGPDGAIYATRYSDAPEDPGAQTRGGVAVFDPSGALLREVPVEPADGRFRAPKSVAVDPLSGEVWINLDAFGPDGSVAYQTLRIAPDGEILEAHASPPELHFVAFDPDGRGWFAESSAGALRLRVIEAGRELAAAALGERRPADFVQDIKFGPDGAAALALWSGRAFLARLTDSGLAIGEVVFARPGECALPEGRSILYTAVVARGSLFATLFCGATVLRAPLPPLRRQPSAAPGETTR